MNSHSRASLICPGGLAPGSSIVILGTSRMQNVCRSREGNLRILYVAFSSCYWEARNTFSMHGIGTTFIDVIVVLFFVGMAGSAVVILISFVEDFKELFGDDESIPDIAPPPMKATASASEYSYSASKPRVHI